MNQSTEDFAARLRSSVALEDLHSALEADHVLAMSRRAQLRRGAGVALAAVCAVASGVALGPALAERLTEHPLPAATPRPEDTLVEIDTTDGTITLPWNRYWLTEAEASEVARASGLAMRTCAAEHGYELPEVGDTGSDIGGTRLYGVWWLPSVEVYGYGYPETPQQAEATRLQAEAAQAGDVPTEEQLAILEECSNDPEIQAYFPPSTARLSETTPDFSAQARETDVGKAAFADWEDCLDAHGLALDPATAPFGVTDGTGDSPPGVATAVLDAQCKAEVDFVARLAQIEADLAAPYIAEHRAELEAIREEQEESLRLARLYVVEHS